MHISEDNVKQTSLYNSVTRTVRQPELFFIELSGTFGSGSVQNVAEPLNCIFLHVLLHEVEARQPSTVLFAPPTSLPRVVCVMNQIHWG